METADQDPVAFALRLMRPALALTPPTYLDDTSRWLQRAGVEQAVVEHNDEAIFDWVVPLLAFQGIGDAAAATFADRNEPITWQLIDDAMRAAPSCPRLRSYWHFDRCGYRKGTLTCAESEHIYDCFLPLLPLRKGSLNEAAVALYLFMRDVCGGDFVAWLDARLAAADPGQSALGRGRALAAAVIEPLCNTPGTGAKLWSMILADLLLAADPARKRWRAAGASMIVVDTLVHAFMHRTGVLHRFAAEHRYGPGCYAPGGCADVIEAIAAHVDARNFNPAFPAHFPRFLAKAIWWFCAEAGHDVCNGRRIDDRRRCRQVFCPAYGWCDRLGLGVSA